MADYLIMPAADMARYDKVKFKISTRATKAPNNARWEIQPLKLKSRTDFAIPISVLTHPAFKRMRGRLRTYAIETLDDSAFDRPSVPI